MLKLPVQSVIRYKVGSKTYDTKEEARAVEYGNLLAYLRACVYEDNTTLPEDSMRDFINILIDNDITSLEKLQALRDTL